MAPNKKLATPQYTAKTALPVPGKALERRDLLQRIAVAQVVWLTAPAGAGKSTFLTSVLQRRQGLVAWYRIDEGDEDLVRAVALLADTLEHCWRMPHGVLPRLGPGPPPNATAFGRKFAEALFEASGEPMLLVFDDVHRISEHAPFLEFLSALSNEFRAPHQLAMAARRAPPPQMARLLVHGEALELRAADLAFNAQEIRALAQALRLPPMSAADFDLVLQRTRGWAAGVVALLSARGAGDRAGLASELALRRLSDYFAHELLAALPERVPQILERVSVASIVPAELAIELSADVNAPAILEGLADRQMFVSRTGWRTQTFEVHALLRESLMYRLARRMPESELRSMMVRAADVFERLGLVSEAVDLYARSRNNQELLRLVLAEAPRLAETGQIATLGAWLSHFPKNQIEAHPWLLLWRATCDLPHNPRAARASFERVFRTLRAAGDWPGSALAWSGIIDAIFFDYTDLTAFDHWLAEYDDSLAPHLRALPASIVRRLFVSLFAATAFRAPGHPRMSALRTQALAMLEGDLDPVISACLRTYLVAHSIWTGRLFEATLLLDELRRSSDAVSHLPILRIMFSLIRSTHALFTASFDAAHEAIEEGLLEAARSHVPIWDAVFLGHRAALALARDDRAAATSCLQLLNAALSADRHHERGRYHQLAGLLAAFEGDLVTAVRHLDAGQACSRRSGDFFSGAFAVGAAAALIHLRHDPRRALSHLRVAERAARATGNAMLAWMAGMLRGLHEIQGGNEQGGRRALADALSIGAEHDYLHFIVFPAPIISAIAYAALERGICCEYVCRLIARNGLRHPTGKPRLENWPWPLRVYTLGRFAIVRDGRKIEFGRKAPRAPLNLLQAIVAFGGTGVPEKRLIDALWPDSDGDAGRNALAAALHRLRHLIGADAVSRRDAKLALDPAFVWVDAWELEGLLTAARSQPAIAVDAFAFAENLRRFYPGAFLEDEHDDDWAIAYRETLHASVLLTLERRIEAAVAAEDWLGVEALCMAGLQTDDRVESFYRSLMLAHLARGDPNAAILVFRRCQRTLSRKLLATPSATTVAVFERANHPMRGRRSTPV
ncbi:MAG TPA: BTAD domain-containing putative transcriptional regulator [Burkholderiaceae bacterium]|jgi:DNA-binding SARP family transcriptional activator|nr:BTAD domain-containing putative transcriptional regulator [Burkholderiaceae bacterium]